jgi:hypothetical protein
MAKKTRNAKKTTKAAKRAKRLTPKAKEKTVRVDAVVRFIKKLDELEQLDEFLTAAEMSKAFITLRGRSHDMVKNFVEQKRQLQPGAERAGARTAARVIDPCDGFECF